MVRQLINSVLKSGLYKDEFVVHMIEEASAI